MSEDSLQVGRLVGDRFLLERKIGAGGYGSVWLATDSERRDVVALKVLHPHLRDNALAVERFAREAEVLVRLDHPNIARPIACGRAGEEVYLALEYVEGVTLRDELVSRAERGEHFTLGELARLVESLGSALVHAHGLGIVHRDLKPANIMLAPVPGGATAKILDFGIAKVLALPSGDATTVGRLLGSWLYMPPEQVRGESVDHRSDIFALGSVLFEAITLRSTFARGDDGRPLIASAVPDLLAGMNNRYNLLRRIALEPRPRPSDSRAGLSPAIDRAVLKALEFEPKDRYQSAAELMAAFRTALDPESPARERPSPPALARAETALPEDLLAQAPVQDETLLKSVLLRDTVLRAPPVRVSIRTHRRRPVNVATAGGLLALLAVIITAAVVYKRSNEIPEPAPVEELPKARAIAAEPRQPEQAQALDPEPQPQKTKKALTPRPRAPEPQPQQPQAQPYAELDRLLAEIRADPGNLERIGRLTDRLKEEADRLQNRAHKNAVKRCATTAAVSADPQDLAACLAQLKNPPNN